ncbi:hypothetical protein [Salinimonas chungwhensis]|uniref:hypothetical protein n=1 Tax=Salinimonas chungwhensis TaxID=265425 RepID=UPI000363985D|nr:hypothetical protein [Salinimonas chungwhensis]
MFEEKYIMTGILAMLLIAAWHKPKFYNEHLANKATIVTVVVLTLFSLWDGAMAIAQQGLPKDLAEECYKAASESIENKAIPVTWWVFSVSIYLISFGLDWLAKALIKHEENE